MTVSIVSSKKSSVRNGVLPKRNSARIRYDVHGLAHEREQSSLCNLLDRKDQVDTQGKPHLIHECHVTSIEELMLKGYKNPFTIATVLNLKVRTVKQYQEQVRVRWQTQGGRDNYFRRRGEARLQLELILQKTWEICDTSQDPRIQLAAMSRAEKIAERLMELDGLSREMIIRIDKASILDRDNLGNDPSAIAEEIERLQAQPEPFLVDIRGGGSPPDPELTEEEQLVTV